MNGLETLVEFIRADTKKVCQEIFNNTSEELSKLKSDYSQDEQTQYWKCINEGTQVVQQRLASLADLASIEAKKQFIVMQEELVNDAFNLAVKKILQLTDEEFSILLRKLDLPPGTTAEDIVSHYRAKLTNAINTMLFD